MSKPTVTDMMVAYAEDGVDYARSRFGESLDYSEASVEAVERCLDQMYREVPRGLLGRLFKKSPSVEEKDVAAKMFGGYVGEVYRKHHGGEWALDTTSVPGSVTIALQHTEVGTIFPPAKVFKRLTNGPEDNVWSYYRVLITEPSLRASGPKP